MVCFWKVLWYRDDENGLKVLVFFVGGDGERLEYLDFAVSPDDCNLAWLVCE